MRWESQVFEASTDDGLKIAFENMAKRKVGALSVAPDTFFSARRAQLVALAAKMRFLAGDYFREFVVDEGLMSYGADLREPSRVAGILLGAF